MEARNTISSRRHGALSSAMTGLMTGLLLLTSGSQHAQGDPGSQPAVKVLAAPDSQRPSGPAKAASTPGLAKRISLDLRQMDVLAVLKFLAEQGDFNIVPGKNVGGRVTLSVKDITIQDALDII